MSESLGPAVVASQPRWAIALILWVVVGVPLGGLVVGLIRWSPRLIYDLRQTPTVTECNRIKAGDTLAEVIAGVNSAAPPFVQRLGRNQFTFARDDAACVVDLDPATLRVARTHSEETPATLWLNGSSGVSKERQGVADMKGGQ